MKKNSNIACSSTLSCQSFSPLLFIRYAPPAFCAPVKEWGNRPKWEFKLKIDWRVGLLPIPCAGILSVGCVVLWSCACCFPAGSWTYVMSNGNTQNELPVQWSESQCSQRPGPRRDWSNCLTCDLLVSLSGKKKGFLFLKKYFYFFTLFED